MPTATIKLFLTHGDPKRLQSETAAELGVLLPSILDRVYIGEL